MRLCGGLAFGTLFPAMASLVFDKQRDSLRYSRAVVVPSQSMRKLLLGCYPDTPPGSDSRLALGSVASRAMTVTRSPPKRPLCGLNTVFRSDALVVLTLSRISPEKGQDLLLRRAGWLGEPNPVFHASRSGCSSAAARPICRERRFLRRLQSMAVEAPQDTGHLPRPCHRHSQAGVLRGGRPLRLSFAP